MQLQAMKSQRTEIFFPASIGIGRAMLINAGIVETCFVLILGAVLALAASAALAVFRRQKWSRTISATCYTAVGVILVACIVAFVAYLPYSQLVAQAMAPHASVRSSLPLLQNFFSFATWGEILYSRPDGVYRWAGLIIVLSLAGLWLVVRQFRRPGSHPTVVSAG
jgi:hypothetical protein